LFDLLDALHRVMCAPEQQVYEVESEAYDVEEKMSWIASAVAEHGSVDFAALMMRCRARAEMIVTFIALLELIKLGTVGVVQAEAFGGIMIVHRTPEGSETQASDQPATRP
jgi:segregation and condensation protein A